jgi:hypothetical protein
VAAAAQSRVEGRARPADVPDFDDNIRKAFRRETELFFGYILRENRSALELLSADYTFVNERLASTTASRVSTARASAGEADRSEPPRVCSGRQHAVADRRSPRDLAVFAASSC